MGATTRTGAIILTGVIILTSAIILAGAALPSGGPAAWRAAWETSLAGTPAPFLAGLGDRALVAARDGRLTAIGPDGATLWQIDLGAPVASMPAGGPRRVAVPGDGAITLLDGASGRALARIEAPGGAPQVVMVPAGLVVAGARGEMLLARPEDGAVLWRATTAAAPPTRPVQCGALLIVGGADGSLTALRAQDGGRAWSGALGGPITTEVVCDRERAYVGSADNRLYALKLGRRRFRVMWSYLTGGDVVGRPVLFSERLIFTSFDTYLYALKAGNGHLAWKTRLGRRPRSDTLLAGDLLLVAPLDAERLQAFRLPSGSPAAFLALEPGQDRFVTPPVSAGGMVVIAAARYGDETVRLIGFDPLAAAAPPSAGGASGP